MNAWKNRHVTQQRIFVLTMKAVMLASIVTNRVMAAAVMVQICVRNVPKDMSYAMECVRVSRNFSLSFVCLFCFSFERFDFYTSFFLL